MKQQFVPDHVACSRPVSSSGGMSVTVEVSSKDLFNGRKFKVMISDSAFPEGLPAHEVAWAAGYYVIERLLDAQLQPGEELWIGSQANELSQRIDRASQNSEACRAAKCPGTGCQRRVVLPKSQILLDHPLPCKGFHGVLTCENGHEFHAAEADLCFYVRPLPPLLERGKGTG